MSSIRFRRVRCDLMSFRVKARIAAPAARFEGRQHRTRRPQRTTGGDSDEAVDCWKAMGVASNVRYTTVRLLVLECGLAKWKGAPVFRY